MPFKEGAACMFVYLQLVVAGNHFNSLTRLQLLLTLFDRLVEQIFVPIQTELIHWIDLVQVVQYEVKDGGHSATAPELLSGFFDFL